MPAEKAPKKFMIEEIIDQVLAGKQPRERALREFTRRTGIDATNDAAVICAQAASNWTAVATEHVGRTFRWIEDLRNLAERRPKVDLANIAIGFLGPGEAVISAALNDLGIALSRWMALLETNAFDGDSGGRPPDSGSAAFAYSVLRLWKILERKAISGPEVALLAVGLGIDDGTATAPVRRWKRHVQLARESIRDGDPSEVGPLTFAFQFLVAAHGGTEASLAAALRDPTFPTRVGGKGSTIPPGV